MRTLSSPGYNRSTLLNEILAPSSERIIEFQGLNRKDVINDGEMPDMRNLTSENYPILSPRKPRGVYEMPDEVVKPLRIHTKFGRIAVIAKDEEENVAFYFDKEKITSVTGLSEDTWMVDINTKICFFPQKTYLEISSTGTGIVIGSYGSLEDTFTASQASPVTVTTSNEDARIDVGSGHNFGYDDAINIEGTLTYTAGGTSHTAPCNASCIIEEVSGTTLVLPRETFIEMTGEGATNITFVGSISRTMPDLDHIIEWNNRLWGASSADNTIYACKLGDPKNWQYFQGTSLDSYYAQQGTDGRWTGCAPYSSHILFFKQGSITKIYGTAPSNYQVTNMQCYGLEEGSRRSVVSINNTVFYKSVVGIMAYDGGVPYCISDNLNSVFKNVVGGTEGRKYYASCQNKKGGFELLVLDIEKGLWHKEDSLRYQDTCMIDNKMFYITHTSESLKCSNDVITSDWTICGTGESSTGHIGIVNPDNYSENYEDIEWYAVFGPFDEYVENRKIYSRILMRLMTNTDADSEVHVYISENEGEWEKVYDFDPANKGGDYIPIIPRRCDRYSIKVEGKGNCGVKSLTRRVRAGTGGRL